MGSLGFTSTPSHVHLKFRKLTAMSMWNRPLWIHPLSQGVWMTPDHLQSFLGSPSLEVWPRFHICKMCAYLCPSEKLLQGLMMVRHTGDDA